jgi:hypothetical protein
MHAVTHLETVPMPTKSPDEVPETVQREMTEIIYRVRGATVTKLLWEEMSESDRQWLEEHLTHEEFENFGPIELWMKLRGVSYARAALDVALTCELLSRRKYNRLLREVGAQDEGLDVDIYDALATAQLVLIDAPPAAYWRRQEIKLDWEGQGVLWDYLWKLAGAAKHRGYIDERHFGLSTRRQNLGHWKYRLCKADGFPVELGELIASKDGRHQLDLSPDTIRRFRKDPDGGYKEISFSTRKR